MAFAEMGGWDTHVGQAGSFARQAGDLARSVRAFFDDLGPLGSDVVLMTMTEFGRTAAMNGSGGTDHGRASAMFVAGGHLSLRDPAALFPGWDGTPLDLIG